MTHCTDCTLRFRRVFLVLRFATRGISVFAAPCVITPQKVCFLFIVFAALVKRRRKVDNSAQSKLRLVPAHTPVAGVSSGAYLPSMIGIAARRAAGAMARPALRSAR